MEIRRLRDPIHDLIVFNLSDDEGVDRVAWELLNKKEFQRLRRIRQLGLSEFVFPGATHSRFSHSIGVYHNARVLEGFDKGMPLEFKSSFTLYEVKRRETLSGIAKEQLGSTKFVDDIFKANLDKLENKDRIYAGRVLRIPVLSPDKVSE